MYSLRRQAEAVAERVALLDNPVKRTPAHAAADELLQICKTKDDASQLVKRQGQVEHPPFC